MKKATTHAVRIAAPIGSTLGLIAALVAFAIVVPLPASAAAVPGHYLFTFNVPGVLQEAGSMAESPSPYWWVNSGAKLIVKDGLGMTVQRELPANDYWRKLYAQTNPLDTDNGYHPQNIFRLVSKQTWGSAMHEMSFRITRNNFSSSPNRDGYNGVLFFARYKDGSNLYYAGVRSDGGATIKKKIGGTYYTLASGQAFGTKGSYNRTSNPSLLPVNTWMGMKLEAKNNADGSVSLQLLLDKENDGTYASILSVKDTGTGGAPIKSGSSGIRTDFMDVEFDNFRVRDL